MINKGGGMLYNWLSGTSSLEADITQPAKFMAPSWCDEGNPRDVVAVMTLMRAVIAPIMLLFLLRGRWWCVRSLCHSVLCVFFRCGNILSLNRGDNGGFAALFSQHAQACLFRGVEVFFLKRQ